MATLDFLQKEKWTITDYETLDPIAEFTSFIEANYKGSVKALEMPCEDSFASYNKVYAPFEMSVRLGIAGDDIDIGQVLANLNVYKDEAKMVTVTTPDQAYEPLTLTSVSYAFKRENGTALLVDLAFKEVRIVTPQYATGGLSQSKCKNPANSDTANKGKQLTSALYDINDLTGIDVKKYMGW